MLTKLYARLYSSEEHKYLPPKYSFALKDLAVFLGIFEVSEDDLMAQRKNLSETSSNLSYVTSSGFNPVKGRGLDVITEDQEQKDDEEEEDDHNKYAGIVKIVKDSDSKDKDNVESGIKVGEKAKSGVKSYVNKSRVITGRNGSKVESNHMSISEANSNNGSRKGARPTANKTVEKVVAPHRRGNEESEVAPVVVKKSGSNSSLGARNRKSNSQQQQILRKNIAPP